jgi:mRNA-degrading endonuclease RelE of RelBE toxin-antitoxin system
MPWTVQLKKQVLKGIRKMPKRAKENLYALIKEIEDSGPVRGNWANYGKLGPGKHHCHFKKGNPTYVAVWEETDGKINLVEVTYAGTHEKSPY